MRGMRCHGTRSLRRKLPLWFAHRTRHPMSESRRSAARAPRTGTPSTSSICALTRTDATCVMSFLSSRRSPTVKGRCACSKSGAGLALRFSRCSRSSLRSMSPRATSPPPPSACSSSIQRSTISAVLRLCGMWRRVARPTARTEMAHSHLSCRLHLSTWRCSSSSSPRSRQTACVRPCAMCMPLCDREESRSSVITESSTPSNASSHRKGRASASGGTRGTTVRWRTSSRPRLSTSSLKPPDSKGSSRARSLMSPRRQQMSTPRHRAKPTPARVRPVMQHSVVRPTTSS
mmetsp:Transcript_9880/g.25550  ORF Transcript_9880/g.25550 Transcript_9880/m.25550 type:complete len:289 (+) Transcript_9880:310-1176(+)